MPTVSNEDPRLERRRAEMVETQIVARGIADRAVLAAMADVPRHLFVEPALVEAAYEDRPLPIGFGQTISQPFMVARVTELARPRPGDRALEVGAGSGYQAAVLARLCTMVYAVEVVGALAARAAEVLSKAGFGNVIIDSFDASAGWPAHAPYDVIIVSAGAPRVPPLLVDQLCDGGRLVVPVGVGDDQRLAVVQRVGHTYSTTTDTRCRYVDLIGRYGFGGAPPIA